MKTNDFKLLIGAIMQIVLMVVVVNAVHPHGTTGLLVSMALLVATEFVVYRDVQRLTKFQLKPAAAPDSAGEQALRRVEALPETRPEPGV